MKLMNVIAVQKIVHLLSTFLLLQCFHDPKLCFDEDIYRKVIEFRDDQEPIFYSS